MSRPEDHPNRVIAGVPLGPGRRCGLDGANSASTPTKGERARLARAEAAWFASAMVFGNLFGQPRIKDGERGHAVVMARDRPSESATHHYIRLSLQVHVASRPPYLLEQRFNVKTSKMPEPGEQLPVTVDRSDPERLRIEWDDVPTWRDKVQAQHEASLQGGGIAGLGGAPNVQVTHHTIDATNDPAALAQVQALLQAQGIDLGQMLGGGAVVHPTPPAPDGVDDVVESLERLVRLRDAGALTPEEFEAQKARILGGG